MDRQRVAGVDDRRPARGTDRAPENSSFAVWFAQHWSGAAGSTRVRCPYDDPLRRVAEAMSEVGARYPGPVGELIGREIRAFVDFGYRFDGSGLVPRLIDDLLEGDVTRGA